MPNPQTALDRSGGTCELCGASEASAQDVPNSPSPSHIAICAACVSAMASPAAYADHWQCLNGSMWSEVPAVQVTAYRLLSAMPNESFAQDALEMLYLDEATTEWAEAGMISAPSGAPAKDANGTTLAAGDTVTLIKDLPVKGAGFTAKRGTAVRGISLTDNPLHIEGRVNGQRIVIISAFVKKSS
ncbi:MAG: PhnA domain-containing protein [Maricaulaceae bacterium]